MTVTPAAAMVLLIGVASSLNAQTVDSAWSAEWKVQVQSMPPARELKVMGREANGDPLYVCRGRYQYWMYPGKYGPSDNYCHIAWDGKAVRLDSFEVLVRARGVWGPKARRAALTTYQAGSDSVRMLSLCRGKHEGGLHPGKLVESACNIAFGDAEVAATDFEVFYRAREGWWLSIADSARAFGGARPVGTSATGKPVYACGWTYVAKMTNTSESNAVAVGNFTPADGDMKCYSIEFAFTNLLTFQPRSDFSVLQLPAGRWVAAPGGTDFSAALFIGQSRGSDAYLCRTHQEGGTLVGLVVPDRSAHCVTGGWGRSYHDSVFEVFLPDW